MATIKIGSTDITEYQTIAIDTDKIQHKIAAKIIVDAYLRDYKMRPKVVSYEEATERSYIIKTVERGQDSPAGEDGFIARTVNGQIELLCSYENALTRAVNEFIFTKFFESRTRGGFSISLYNGVISGVVASLFLLIKSGLPTDMNMGAFIISLLYAV